MPIASSSRTGASSPARASRQASTSTLYVIGQQLGHQVAATVARDLVVYMRRSGGDPQLSPWVMHRNHVHPVLHRVQDAVIKDPAAQWTAARLASVACMSSRNLARLFAEHAGCSPLDYVQRLRVALARELVTNSELAMERVAERTGFSSAHQLRRVWRRWEATPPTAHRARDVGLKPRPAAGAPGQSLTHRCYPSRHERGRGSSGRRPDGRDHRRRDRRHGRQDKIRRRTASASIAARRSTARTAPRAASACTCIAASSTSATTSCTACSTSKARCGARFPSCSSIPAGSRAATSTASAPSSSRRWRCTCSPCS